MPKISIIIPIYNSEEFLNQSIESLLHQSLKEIEVILVNDGSTDRSGEICDSFAERDFRIKVINKTNSGAADSRKLGIESATGDYIGFLDSDDWVHPDMYKTLYEYAKKENADIVQCGYISTHQRTEKMNFIQSKYHKYKIMTSREAFLQLYGMIDEKNINFLLWNKIIRRECFNGAELDSMVKSKIDDAPVVARLIYLSKSVVVTSEPFVYYYQHNNDEIKSVMGSMKESDKDFIISHVNSFNDISQFLKKKDKELYQISQKYTIQWCLSAIKNRNVSWREKCNVINLVKSFRAYNNSALRLKMRIACFLLGLVPVKI